MYIIILNNVPDKLVPVISSDASLACYKKYKNCKNTKKWINGIFNI